MAKLSQQVWEVVSETIRRRNDMLFVKLGRQPPTLSSEFEKDVRAFVKDLSDAQEANAIRIHKGSPEVAVRSVKQNQALLAIQQFWINLLVKRT